jgi:hypothetical protein
MMKGGEQGLTFFIQNLSIGARLYNLGRDGSKKWCHNILQLIGYNSSVIKLSALYNKRKAQKMGKMVEQQIVRKKLQREDGHHRLSLYGAICIHRVHQCQQIKGPKVDT